MTGMADYCEAISRAEGEAPDYDQGGEREAESGGDEAGAGEAVTEGDGGRGRTGFDWGEVTEDGGGE